MNHLLAIIGMVIALPVCLCADIDSPVPPPPQPVPITAQTMMGERVEIMLKGRTRSGLPLTFLIRTPPSAGTLSEPEFDGNYSAKVIYQPNPGSNAQTDFFTYAVQAPNTGVSAPERVVIRLIEPASEFEGPSSLTFGGVLLGESESKKITLTNAGGGVIKGKVLPPSPWTVSDGGSYILAAGKSKEFTMTFSPTGAHEYREVASYSHNPQLRLSLYGEGLLPIRVVTKKISLEPNSQGERQGEISITNLSQRRQTVKFQTPAHILPIPATDIEAVETAKIPVHAVPTHLDAVNGEIGIECGAFKTSVSVSGFAMPAKLTFSAGKKLDFGEVMPGRVFRRSLIIANSGGAAAALRLIAPDEITLNPDLAKTPIPPGKTVSFEIVFEPRADTKSQVELVFLRNEQEINRISLPFVLKINKMDMPGVPAVAAPSAQQTAAPSQEEKPGALRIISAPTGPPPVITRVSLVEQRVSSLKIQWQKPPNSAFTDYTLEGRTVKKGPDGKLEWIWSRLRSVHITSDDQNIYASVTGLPPGTVLTYRIVAKDKSGSFQPLSEGFSLATKYKKPFRISPLLILIVAFVVIAFFIWRKRKRQIDALREDMNRTRRII